MHSDTTPALKMVDSQSGLGSDADARTTKPGIQVTSTTRARRPSMGFEHNPLQVQGRRLKRRSTFHNETLEERVTESSINLSRQDAPVPDAPRTLNAPRGTSEESVRISTSGPAPEGFATPESATSSPKRRPLARTASFSSRYSQTFSPSPLSQASTIASEESTEEEQRAGVRAGKKVLDAFGDTSMKERCRSASLGTASLRTYSLRSSRCRHLYDGRILSHGGGPSSLPSHSLKALGEKESPLLLPSSLVPSSTRPSPAPLSPFEHSTNPSTSRDPSKNWMTATATPRFSRTSLPAVVMPVAATARHRVDLSPSRTSSQASLHSSDSGELPRLWRTQSRGSNLRSFSSRESMKSFATAPVTPISGTTPTNSSWISRFSLGDKKSSSKASSVDALHGIRVQVQAVRGRGTKMATVSTLRSLPEASNTPKSTNDNTFRRIKGALNQVLSRKGWP